MRFDHHSRLAVTSLLVCIAATILASAATHHRTQISLPHQTPTFYRDVLPILQQHCQSCHRSQGIGPMPLETYDQARRKAADMIAKVTSHKMPPWFADPRFGHCANDPTLSSQEIATLRAWVESGATPGDPRDAPPPLQWAAGWNIP